MKPWIALLATALALAAQTPEVELRLSTLEGKTSFHLGETIALQLSFTSTAAGKYYIPRGSWDDKGPTFAESFRTVPNAPAAPRPANGRVMGGIGTNQELSAKPAVLPVDLNAWVRFDRAGHYRVRATSNRVKQGDPSRFMGTPVELESNEIEIELLDDPAWRTAQAAECVRVLQAVPRNGDTETHEERMAAAHQLGYLDTPESVRESARLFDGSDVQVDQVLRRGLLLSSRRPLAIEAMGQALVDPSHPIVPSFMETLASLESTTARQLTSRLAGAVERKRGSARAISRRTLIESSETADEVPAALRTEIANEFFDLPERDQTAVLSWEWSRVASPAMLPVLRKICDSMTATRSSEPSLAAAAMERLYELDPVDARRRILAEMALPSPRLPFLTLSLLPDETLPELESQWVTNLENRNGARNAIEELIARYGSKSIKAQVKSFYQALDVEMLTREGTVGDPPKRIASPACEPPLYAYFLRVDPPYGEKLLRQVMADRDSEFGRCWMTALGRTAPYYVSSEWERVAIDGLMDKTVLVKIDAVKALGKYGSPASKVALFDSFRYFHEWWKDKPAQMNDENRQLEWTYVQAINGASNWMASADDLSRAASLCISDSCRQQMEQTRAYWTNPPLAVSAGRSSDGSYSVWLMQYNERSLEAGRRRLLQIPSGTHIQLKTQGWPDEKLNQWMDQMQRELEDRGISVGR